MSYSFLRTTGHTRAHSPQPVHFEDVDVAGFLKELYREISRFACNLLNFGQGQKLDVQVPADLDQLGRNNSHRAFIRRESLVQLRHDAADRRLFFDQIDVIAAIGKIERRLHPCNPASDYHYGADYFLWRDRCRS